MTVRDQMQRLVELPVYPPRRIVSLVPSQTELLYDLGLDAEVVGITKFCVHPPHWFRQKHRIGGTKQVKQAVIESLQPDLIIGNKEENDREQIEILATRYPVWMSDVHTLSDAAHMMQMIGQLTGRTETAQRLVQQIQQTFAPVPKPQPLRRAAYFIWRKPWMVAAADTFIHEMLQIAGFVNVFERRTRYPEIALSELAEANPEVILLSSEPYPFQQKHIAEIEHFCPSAVIQLVDGELFSWYGSRLQYSAAYFVLLQSRINLQVQNF